MLPIRSLTKIQSGKSWLKRGLATAVSDYQVGSKIHGFSVKEVRTIPELKLTGVLLDHQQTGASHLHVAKNDANNVFSIGFKTMPTDSTGVAHILEHTTLCGSKKYPVRDPFFKMLNRSLATYMNAWTAHDYTNYPFATQSKKDFDNLLQVYLDATLDPLLLESDFQQEGWRLEKEDINNPKSEWQIKGVVFNEMKGALSDPGAYFYYQHQHHLYKSTPYSHNSGGDPLNIPDLSYSDLKKFHLDHYRPENARSFTYGDGDLAHALNVINSKYQEISSIRSNNVPFVDSSISAPVPKLDSPKEVIVDGPFDPLSSEDKQHKISVSFLTNDLKNSYQSLCLSLLTNLLISGPSSPLHQALLDTNLGAEYSSTTGYNQHGKKGAISIGLQGCQADQLEHIQKVIFETLEKVKTEGFTKERIESVLVPIELGYKHRTGNFGVGLVQGLFSTWIDGNNPLESLEISKNLARLRKDIEKSDFFPSLISKHLLENQQRMTFIMQPSTSFPSIQAQLHQKLLTRTVDSNVQSPADETKLIDQAQLLQKRQDQIEDISCLPGLALSDINQQPQWFDVNKEKTDELELYWRDSETNGISYIDAINQVDELPDRLRKLLPLFCDCLTYMGTTTNPISKLDQDMKLYTGGIHFSPYTGTNLSDPTQLMQGIQITSHCLDSRVPNMYRLILDIVHNCKFDDFDRIKSLIIGNASSLSNSIADSGHGYAKGHAASKLSIPMAAAEMLNGLEQVTFMNTLASLDDFSKVAEQLKELRSIVLAKGNMKALVVSDKEQHPIHRQYLSEFVQSLNDMPKSFLTDLTLPSNIGLNSWIDLPFNSYYTGMSLNSLNYTHEDSPKLQVMSQLLSNLYLHREVREKGGAYGGGSVYSAIYGQLQFYSYRDPLPQRNVESTYQQSLQWLANQTVSQRELDEAKLSIFQSLDKPHSAGSEGKAQFLLGVELDIVQQRRAAFLSTTSNDVSRLAQSVLLDIEAGKAAATIIGAPPATPPANWTITKV